MERLSNQDELLGRIVRSPGRVVLLRGPAGAGKTTAAFGLYRMFSESVAAPPCRLIVPNEATARCLRGLLLADSPAGVLFAPAVFTFAALARRILAARGRGTAHLSEFDSHLMLRAIVDELNRHDELDSLGVAADTPGLVRAVGRAISELKRTAVDPEDLARAVGTERGKAGNILKIYRRYQHRLGEKQLYDREGQMWLARDELLAAADVPNEGLGLAGIEALAVDGFTDLNPTQLEILALLSPRLKHLLVTLPLPPDGDERERMWRWTARTRQRLVETFGDELDEIQLPPADEDDSLRGLWRSVFDYDAPPRQAPAELRVIAAAGIDAEVAATARRVKRLLLDGAPPGSIAVLARNMNAYRGPVERIFRDYDIPVRDGPSVLGDIPIVRFFLAVASLPSGDFGYREVLGVIGNSYFRPRSLGDFSAATVAAAERIIREGNVLSGRDEYKTAAVRIAKRAARQEQNEEDQNDLPATASGDLQAASLMLQKLFDLSDSPRSPVDMAGLIDELELSHAACEHDQADRVARDLRALEKLREALEHSEQAGDSSSPVDAGRLREALGQVQLPAPRCEGVVDVLAVLDARAMRWRHVLLLGCSEGQFPAGFDEGSLLSEAQRGSWAAGGVMLDRRSDLTAREMLLFYLAVSRADDSLTLSYLKFDDGGRASAQGSFIEAFLDPIGGLEALAERGSVEIVRPGRFVPPPGQIASKGEALNAAVAGLFNDQYELSADALDYSAEHQPEMLRRVSAGLWAGRRRWTAEQCSEFDGRISAPALLGLLAERIPARTVFSPSRLSTFGRCGWRYFARYVLNLQPVITPQRQLEAASGGIFCHNVLCATLSGLAEMHARPLILADVDAKTLEAAMEEAFEAEARRVEAQSPPYRVLWEIQQRQMRRVLHDYLLVEHRNTLLPAQCLYFELGFGMEDRPAEMLDAASEAEPVYIETPAGTIRLRGKIDRLDRVEFDGRAGLLVVDYKTGRLPSYDENIDGRNLQMPLYIRAVEKFLGEDCLGGVFHGLADGQKKSFFAAMRLSRGRLKQMDNFHDELDRAIDTVGRFIEQMRAGRFDLLPADEVSCRRCEFRQACHYSPARAEFRGHGRTEEAK